MGRKLRYPMRRMLAISQDTEAGLIKIAIKYKKAEAALAREYVERGVASDLKSLDKAGQ